MTELVRPIAESQDSPFIIEYVFGDGASLLEIVTAGHIYKSPQGERVVPSRSETSTPFSDRVALTRKLIELDAFERGNDFVSGVIAGSGVKL